MMAWLRTIGDELIGLFVDDVAFAIGIVVWLLVACLGLPRLGLGGVWPAVLLSAGLLVILVESAVRRARN
jgi:hypothetical protein